MKIILTGATGYVGEGTLIELLKVDGVEKVLSVSRKPTGIKHEKLEEYLVSDFMELKEGDTHFSGYDAVFFIAGITSVGTPMDVYVRISQEIPLHFADIMPDKERMTFIYLSGAGTTPDGKPFYPLLRLLGLANNMKEIALSQLVLTRDGYDKLVISPKDIVELAKRF